MRHFLLLLLSAVFFAATLGTATAQVPRMFSYQGAIMDATQHPISDGAHAISIKLYSGNTAVFTENHPGVQTRGGIFNVLVGSGGGPLPVNFFDSLGVSVDGGAEMMPRTAVASAPYSLVAAALAPGALNAVTSVNGQFGAISLQGTGGTTITNTGSTFTINSTGTGGSGIQGVNNIDGSIAIGNPNGPIAAIPVKDGGITTAKLADASVTSAKIGTATIDAGMVLAADGTGGAVWQSGTGAIALPFAGTVTVTPAPAFSITNLAAGAGVLSGVAGTFTVNNVNSSAIALVGTSNGNASSVGSYGANTGLGRGGFFEVTNPNNSATALTGNTQGLGVATSVTIVNNVNTSNALQVSTTGTGKAGQFKITNPANASSALDISTTGTGNGVTSAAVTGIGVFGSATNNTATNSGVVGQTFSPNGSGVTANYAGAGTGIPLLLNNGPIKVAGASKAAFKWTAVAGNIAANFTTITNPLTDGDPNAILFVTQLLDANAIYTNLPVGVWYNAAVGKWTIFLENVNAPMPVNAAFNVIVFKQ